MTRLALITAIAVASPAAAQFVKPGTPANWVDTIRVDRLPTGSCHWSTAGARMRPGKPGTTTMPGPADEKTCMVLFSNYTTGSPTDRPSTVGFAYMQDRKRPVPPGATLNFADTFTVARTTDGGCDWSKTPARQGKPGSSSYVAEVLVAKCWGVVHNLTFPPRTDEGMKADTFTLIPTGDGRQLPPEAAQQIDAVVRREFANRDTVTISNRRFKGDSAWVNVQHTPTSWTHFTLVWRNGAWTITARSTSNR